MEIDVVMFDYDDPEGLKARTVCLGAAKMNSPKEIDGLRGLLTRGTPPAHVAV